MTKFDNVNPSSMLDDFIFCRSCTVFSHVPKVKKSAKTNNCDN